MPGQFFIIGPQRCGTTLLRLMLDGHSQMRCVGEFDFTTDILAERGALPSPSEAADALTAHRGFRVLGWQPEPGLPYWDQARRALDDLGGDAAWKGATVHHGYAKIREQWPNAKFIFLVRDPRDVARSVIQMGWSGNAWEASRRWTSAVEEWQSFREGLADDDFVLLRFEDLVRDPKRSLSAICRMLDLDYDPAMLDYPETSTYSAPDPTVAFRWNRDASRESVRLTEARTAPFLAQFGYEPANRPVFPEGLHAVSLKLQDKLYRMSFRRRRYGTSLYLRERIAARAGMHGVAARLGRRLQDIDDLHLR